MHNTNEIVEEAKRKRTLAGLKPTALPENHNTINTHKQELQNNGNTSLTEEQKHGKSVKQEINHSDINSQPESQFLCNSGKTDLPATLNTIKKVKVTVYITEEAWEDFNNIYGRRILDKRKTDKGDLMTEAIALLKQQENSRNSSK